MKLVTYTIQINRDDGTDNEDEIHHVNELKEFMNKLLSLFEHTTMEVVKVESDEDEEMIKLMSEDPLDLKDSSDDRNWGSDDYEATGS